MLRFYEVVSTSDVQRFDEVVSSDARLVIGTAPGEWVTKRDQMRFGVETEGVRLTAGDNPQGYEEGSMGWAVDEPVFGLPDGSEMRIRLTFVMHQEGGTWKILHGHFSVGVPDEDVANLQRGWGTGP
ncbi:MAG TPA: nuclear transport factor 2 family protein [Actinomycetota bacterium]|nr:nuclear transport factor 2 family protein [Actinomycetota bacterium]